jgi:hypothetical protein
MDSFDLEELPYPALVSAVEKMSPRELFILTNWSPFIYLQVKNSVRPVIQIELTDVPDARKQLTFYQIMLERFPKTTLVLILKLPTLPITVTYEEIRNRAVFARSVLRRFPKTRVVVEDPNFYDKWKYLEYLKTVVGFGYSKLFIPIADTMTVEDLQTNLPGSFDGSLVEYAEYMGKDKIAEYLRGRIANNTAGRSMYVI